MERFILDNFRWFMDKSTIEEFRVSWVPRVCYYSKKIIWLKPIIKIRYPDYDGLWTAYFTPESYAILVLRYG